MKIETIIRLMALVIVLGIGNVTKLYADEQVAPRAQRVPAIQTPIEKVLPNGEKLTLLLRGDERKHWIMTLDGWQVIEKNEYFYYAKAKKAHEKSNGEVKVQRSCRKAHNQGERSKCEVRWLEKHGVRKEKVNNLIS